MSQNKKIYLLIIIFFTIFLLPIQKPAYAYLDPGTGSLILQVLLGGFLAVLYLTKRSFKKLKIFLSRFLPKKKTSDE